MKILFIGHDAGRNGAPLLLLLFLKWLRQNSTLEFEILLRSGGDLTPEYRAIASTRILDIDVLPPWKSTLRNRLARKFGLLPNLQQRLRRYYPKELFPLVYSNTITNSQLVSSFAAAGHRVICHAHEMKVAIERWGGPDARIAAKSVYHFIAASAPVKRDICSTLGVPETKIEVVHEFGQPVELSSHQRAAARQRIRMQLGIDSSSIVVGMCGTTDWRKGADLFPRLAKEVCSSASGSRFHFLWVGANLHSAEVAQLAHDVSRLGLCGKVTYVENLKNPHEHFSAMDLFALTSREDPFPLAMLEAASMGLPIICFDASGGGPEFVGEDAGITVPYLDVGALAGAIVTLGQNFELRQTYGDRAQSKALSDYSIASQAPKLLEVITRNL